MAAIDLDPLYRTRVVAKLEGVTSRAIYDRIRDGRFPPPDVKADRRGAPDMWYQSTIQRFREEREARAAKRGQSAAA